MLPRVASLAAARLRATSCLLLVEKAPLHRAAGTEALSLAKSSFSSSATASAGTRSGTVFSTFASSRASTGALASTSTPSSSSVLPSALPSLFQRRHASSKAAASRAAAAAGLKMYKPTTPGMRGRVVTSRTSLWKGGPEKGLSFGTSKTGGRNSSGRVTARHRGGGHRTVLRAVDFWRVPKESGREVGASTSSASAAASPRSPSTTRAEVERVEYDPGRSAHIALIRAVGELGGGGEIPLSGRRGHVTREGRSYILAPAGVSPGDVVSAGPGSPVLPGCSLPLSEIPVGTQVHNVEILPGRGGQLARAAGAAAVVVSRGVPLSTSASSAPTSSSTSTSAIAIDPNSYAIVRLPSGAQRKILARCYATVGSLSNAAHKNRKLGKAGASRWSGRRPHVRGVAMNSVDHPMGGGRGKSKGRISQSPTGVPAKGKKTRDRKSRTDVFVHVERPRGK